MPTTKLNNVDKQNTLAAQLQSVEGNVTTTIMAGKWHLEPGSTTNAEDYTAAAAAVGEAGFAHPAAVYIENMDGATVKTNGWSHNNEWTAAESISSVQASIDAGDDFFLYFAPTGPHAYVYGFTF